MKPPVEYSVLPVLALITNLVWQTCSAEGYDYYFPGSDGGDYGNYGYPDNTYRSNYGNNEQNPGGEPGQEGDSNKDYSHNYANYGFDYSVVGGYEYEDKPTSIECYSCHFDIQYGHTKGMEDCHNPFVGTDIPHVTCEGPCGKMYQKLNDLGDEYMVSRNCMPGCKEISEERGYTQCCSTPLCNAATRPTFTASHWTVLVTCAFLWTFARVFLHPHQHR